ncbi:MAG: hypothetical protein J6U87_00615 [Clostridia bacterium]|nr:hypothetical protein [Clostridia bacterium]
MQKQKTKRKTTLGRLVIANLLAAFLLLFVTVSVLAAMGLLGSILAFIF